MREGGSENAHLSTPAERRKQLKFAENGRA
jgi:hypothetical protein